MLRTIAAVVEQDGSIRLLEKVNLKNSHKAIVTILDDLLEQDSTAISETALLSEQSLSDWNRPEEDEAWAHLKPQK